MYFTKIPRFLFLHYNVDSNTKCSDKSWAKNEGSLEVHQKKVLNIAELRSTSSCSFEDNPSVIRTWVAMQNL